MKKLLTDYTQEELKTVVSPGYRAKQLFLWVQSGAEFAKMSNLPKSMLQAIEEEYDSVGVTIKEAFVSREDGTEKYLYKLRDGNLIEGVLMSYKYGRTLCVSTQVGCRMNCAFCASGIGGLIRNLSAGEILGQIIAVNKRFGESRAVTNVVLMGSGEPLDNYGNVKAFLGLASSGQGISERNISLSTSGIVPGIYALADDGFKVTLTVSLHAPTDEKREKLMPVTRAYCIDEIITAAKYYFGKTGRRVIFEYALIDGVNDSKADAVTLSKRIKGFPTHVNLIRLNYVEEKKLKPATNERVKDFLDTLTKNGVSATIRRTMGSDIAGACGQLRRKFEEE